ncbi:cytochrome P460 family protein [Leisingera caerulea]|uniref:Cytochrome P460 family protein n=1 Tax=Leisingera caerulea TaxID=506591 RepID=A0ABY5WYV8_LEICA|nr:cytochrome P460 family protein [Leisingera caerulea]UWQ50791.1 cytochrome P460 family protein [Leisingera caerulea]UWQ59487.1 cytochrome P460 family protein [Leisingera caerulea]
MTLRVTFSAGLLALAPIGAFAQDCTVEGDPMDLEADAVAAVYDCIEARMAEGYAANGDPVAAEFRSWQVTSTRPALAGPHGERFLQTFANDTAAEQYLKFAEEGVEMPAGSVLAKESFAVKDGKAVPGPLFIMTKLEEGGAPDAGDWLYAALMPNGKEMKIQQGFCAGCHLNWEAQDSLAYPMEDVRLTSQ